jgi:hypothetical protein
MNTRIQRWQPKNKLKKLKKPLKTKQQWQPQMDQTPFLT